MSLESERRAAAELAMKGGQARARAQHEANEAKARAREKKAQLAKNLKGSGPTRHVPRGSMNRLDSVWRELSDAYFPGVVTAQWFVMEDGKPKGGKEVGLCVKLVQRYSVPLVERYFRFAFGNWLALHTRFPKSPVMPTVGWLFVMAESLIPEVQMPEPVSETSPEYEALKQWFREHPNETTPPEELMARLPLNFKKGG